MKIEDALAKLDPENDEHWTTEGKPRVDVVNAIMADDDPLSEAVNRGDIVNTAPDLNRATAVTSDEETDEDGAADDENGPDETEEASDAENEHENELGAENETPAVENEPEDVPELDKDFDETSPLALELPDPLPEDATDEERDELRQMLTEGVKFIEGHASGIKTQIVKMQVYLDNLNAAAAKVHDRLDNEVGGIPLASALRDYINGSAAERLRRHEERTGVVPTAKAPIDAAFAHRRQRGGQRPAVPLIKRG